jgi:peptidoglycan/xylan/chitin deacetylase (PgdA/CDA1 family)
MNIFKLSKFNVLIIIAILVTVVTGSIYTIKSQNEKNVSKLNQPVVIENQTSFEPQLPIIIEKNPINLNKVFSPDGDKYFASSQKVAPVLYNIKTAKPVIFLGIDDGVKKSPEALEYFKQKQWPMTMFINQIYYKENIDYFKSIVATGANVGSHTINHPDLSKLTYEQQRKEICNAQDGYEKDFGAKAKFFRPPYGNFNENTKIAAKNCGHIALIHWRARVDEGAVFYQVGKKLNPGEIVLMHFRPRIMDDLKAFDEEITKQGLSVQNLNDWIE